MSNPASDFETGLVGPVGVVGLGSGRTSDGLQGSPLRPASAKSGLMRLRAVDPVDPVGGVADFIWEFVSASAEPLLPCKPRQLYGRRMSEGRAGALDHPALVARYRSVVERGIPQTYEQVHRVDGHQALVVHRVLRVGTGVSVALTILSAERHGPSAWRSAYESAFPS